MSSFREAAAKNEEGRRLLAAGDYTRAIRAFDDAIRLKPDFAEAMSHRATARRRAGLSVETAPNSDEDGTSSPVKIASVVVLGLGVFVLLNACGWAADDRPTCSQRAGRGSFSGSLFGSGGQLHPDAGFWGAMAALSDRGCKRDNPWAFWN